MRLPSARRAALHLGVAVALGILGYLAHPDPAASPTFAMGLFLGALLGVLPWAFGPATPAAAGGQRRPSPAGQGGSSEHKTVYVGNLAFKATRDELRALFEPYGTVHSVRIMTDRQTRKPRGFGFVEMDGAGADAAIEALDGSEFCGRALRVNVGKERPRNRD